MWIKINARHLIAGMLALALGGNALAAGLVARLDRTRVAEGDAVVLTLSTGGDANGAPDLTPLQKDFDLVNRGQSSHMQIINGHSSSSREWILTLMPKRTGKIEIPAIKFGATTSAPLSLEVLPASQAAKQGMPQPVLVEVESEPKQSYVQQKVIYTVRLLFNVPLRDATLSEPRVSDAIVEQLGDERRYETQRNGQPFQVVERRYAILPQHSGPLTVGAPALSARVPEPGQQRGNSLRDRFFGRDPFAGMGMLSSQMRPIQVRGQDLTIDVQAQPPGTPTPWLPAESLTLNEVWAPNPPVFRVGEPVTRTIAITAHGLTGEQLPELELDAPPGVKIYPDKSHTETRPDKDTLVAQKLLKAALVPSQTGRLTLPEVTLSWWDTRHGSLQVARLPAREVQVLPGQTGAEQASNSTAGTPPARYAAPAAGRGSAGQPASTAGGPLAGVAQPRQSAGAPVSLWPWLAALFGAGWLVSTALWLRARRAGPVNKAGEQPVPMSTAAQAGRSLTQVQKAFRSNDLRAARQALLDWARGRWPADPPLGLETLAPRLGRAAAPVLQDIDRRLYAGDTGDWDGVSAWSRLAPDLARDAEARRAQGRTSPLPPLYPSEV